MKTSASLRYVIAVSYEFSIGTWSATSCRAFHPVCFTANTISKNCKRRYNYTFPDSPHSPFLHSSAEMDFAEGIFIEVGFTELGFSGALASADSTSMQYNFVTM